jgi:molecular chaperone GrpE (heat shock protein)
MPAPTAPKLAKWPFLAGDAFLLWTACFIYIQSKVPMRSVELLLAAACIAVGALLAVVPFILEYRALARLVEVDALTTVVAQIQALEKIAEAIAAATGRWQNAQDAADKTAAAARSIADRMAAEVRAFSEFMQKVNDSERTTLRLEVEKLRRGENDWLQVLVRMLDHVHALNAGAKRSGQPRLIEQLGHFQDACRDAARRVGVVPFHPEPEERFDGGRHQVFEGNGEVPSGATVAETIATGYTFQGRLVRPALVRLQDAMTSAETLPAEKKL